MSQCLVLILNEKIYATLTVSINLLTAAGIFLVFFFYNIVRDK